MCSKEEERNCQYCGASHYCDLDLKREHWMPCTNAWCNIPPSVVCHCVGTGERCDNCNQNFCEANELKPGDPLNVSGLAILEMFRLYKNMAVVLADMQHVFDANSSVTDDEEEPITDDEDMVELKTKDFHKKTPTKTHKDRARKEAREEALKEARRGRRKTQA